MITKLFLLFFVLFISELQAGTQPASVHHRDRRYSTQYVYNSRTGSCYKFHRQAGSWHAAHKTCLDESADLAVADTEVEAVVLQNIFSLNPRSTIDSNSDRNVAFVGIRDTLDGDLWKTTDGKSIAETAFRWANGEPNNYDGSEYCGSFGRNGRLHDDSCDLKLPFICERKSGLLCGYES